MNVSRPIRWLAVAACTVCVTAAILLLIPSTRSPIVSMIDMLLQRKTIEDRQEEYGAVVRGRLAPDFERVGVAYPPRSVVLVGLKRERVIEVWVSGGPSGDDSSYRKLRTYPVHGASGTLGPKLREGDLQVPEGFYAVESLNPNSRFHLSLRLNYPNDFDRQQAQEDGRTELGGDIMIHGGRSSIGCLAMGDEAAEDLFILAADTGIENVRVILSPVDFRLNEIPSAETTPPAWVNELYAQIRDELGTLR